jgi:putative peptidoglycan lipid II flippase
MPNPREPGSGGFAAVLGVFGGQRGLSPCSAHPIVRGMATSGRFVPSAWLIAALTLASRLLGLVRESIFSYYFSTSELLSAFRIAFQAPNLARRLFGEGALSSAMIPVLTESIQQRGEEESRRFVGTILTLLATVLGLAVIGIEIIIAVWRTFHDDLALRLTAVLMPYMALICTAAVASGVLNVRQHFAVPAAAPTILNVVMIVALVGGALLGGLTQASLMYLVCGGVLLAGVIQVGITGVALRRASFFPTFGGTWRDPQLRRVFVLMAPMALGLSAVQINTLMDSVIAYLFIREGGERVGPAVLGYAQFLYQLPLGVFGISLATAIFPILSSKAAEGDRVGMADVFERGIRMSLFLALPSSIGLIFVAHPLVATLYQRGEFDASDTQRVASTLVYYSLGLAAYFAQHIVIRTFYALQESRTPARVAVYMVALNLAMNLSLVFVMEERGLALSTSVSATVQVIWLLAKLRRVLPEIGWVRLGLGLTRTVLATAVMAVVLWILTATGLSIHRLVGRSVFELAILVGAGLAVYYLAARVLKIEELATALQYTGDGG